MLKPGNVPKEAIAELRAFLNSCDCDDCVSVAIAAAINAWPGVYANGLQKGWKHYTPALILPLPQENPDAASK